MTVHVQNGGHANKNRHYILILRRKYKKFLVAILSFLHNVIYSINQVHSPVTLFKEILVRLTINPIDIYNLHCAFIRFLSKRFYITLLRK